jgi:dihydropteroate synthase
MGIVNVTPDSFSDGGRYSEARQRLPTEQIWPGAGGPARRRRRDRRGPAPLRSTPEELRRLCPSIGELAARGRPVSIDTTKASVAAAASKPAPWSTTSGGTADRPARVVASAGAMLVVMHTRDPRTMSTEAHYDGVVASVGNELRARSTPAVSAGVAPARSSPTRASASRRPRAEPRAARRASRALGASSAAADRVAQVVPRAAAGRRRSTARRSHAATTVWSFGRGAAVVRVHDVAASARAVALLDALERATQEGMAA